MAARRLSIPEQSAQSVLTLSRDVAALIPLRANVAAAIVYPTAGLDMRPLKRTITKVRKELKLQTVRAAVVALERCDGEGDGDTMTSAVTVAVAFTYAHASVPRRRSGALSGPKRSLWLDVASSPHPVAVAPQR